MSRIQSSQQSNAAMALRSIFIHFYPADGTHLGRSMGSLSIFGREHSAIPEAGTVQGNHRRCWIQLRAIRESVVWRVQHSFRIQIMRTKLEFVEIDFYSQLEVPIELTKIKVSKNC